MLAYTQTHICTNKYTSEATENTHIHTYMHAYKPTHGCKQTQICTYTHNVRVGTENVSLSHVQLFATPWTMQSMEFSGQNTGVGGLSLLQGIFPTQLSSRGILYCWWILYQIRYQRICAHAYKHTHGRILTNTCT